jgi:hypothetical protein
MAQPIIFVTFTESPPWDSTIKEHDKVMADCHQSAAGMWTGRMLPDHFASGAAAAYGYRQRKPETIKRKQRDAARGAALMGGLVSLVWTGLLMRSVLGHQAIQARADYARITLYGPSYLYQTDRRRNQPDKAFEITRVTDQETIILALEMDRVYQDGFNSNKTTKTTHLGGTP